MTLKVTAIKSAVDLDQHGNKSYFVSVEGFADGVLVKHKGEKPLVQVGDDLEQHGYDRIEEVTKRSGDGAYLKALRPEKQNSYGSGNRGDLSPEAQARIDAVGRAKSRCHAQAVAASMLAASGDLAAVDFNDGPQANAFLNGVFKPLVQWLTNDAEKAKDATPTPPASGTINNQGVTNGPGQ